MHIEAFDYDLPAALIAQRPAERRDESRLLVVRDGDPGSVEHRRFGELATLLRAGDLLVLNDVRVLPARVQARRRTGGRVELLFLSPVPGPARPERWYALVRPSKRVRLGDRLRVADATELTVVQERERGVRVLELEGRAGVSDLLERHGTMPLPPYIHAGGSAERDELDRDRYQTVYASSPGAVAAPTAGLHFTQELLGALRDAGVEIAELTLHVGPGTFRPVTCSRIDEHVMDPERYEIPAATADAVTRARAEGRRVVAVGTTAVRSLEHSALDGGQVVAGPGSADLYVRPGFRFQVIDAMITNFHLPRSTPILLVAALIGRRRLLDAYAEAIERGYRFYSYGDAMLVVP